jgi:hypothetical protein
MYSLIFLDVIYTHAHKLNLMYVKKVTLILAQ